MSLSNWRQFQFYESVPIKDPELGSDEPLYSDPTLCASAPVDATELFIAVKSTYIKLINLAESKVTYHFNAFEEDYQITCLKVIDKIFLVAIGECIGKPSLIKVYKLDKLAS